MLFGEVSIYKLVFFFGMEYQNRGRLAWGGGFIHTYKRVKVG